MASISLGSGAPIEMSIINTDPRQLRSFQKFDKAYVIRIVYIPNPPSITSASQDVYIPDVFADGLYYKFVSKVAEALGNQEISTIFEAKYQNWLRENRLIARSKTKTIFKLNYSMP